MNLLYSLELNMDLPSAQASAVGGSTQASQEQVGVYLASSTGYDDVETS